MLRECVLLLILSKKRENKAMNIESKNKKFKHNHK